MKKEYWKEIPNYDGRYLINIEGDIMDLRPERCDDQHWTTPIEYRMLVSNTGQVSLGKNGKYRQKKIILLLKEVFSDLLLMSEEEIDLLKEKARTQDSITYTIEDFNKLIYPNKVIKLYDKTYNVSHHIDPKDRRKTLWRKPNVVPMTNGKILIKKGHTYFGYGLTNLIYIKDMIPHNGKPMEEPVSKSYMQKTKNTENLKQHHITELF